ncbi:methyl-accepting chemotaxis protein [Terribacillus sp. DMT04]|uniref:methyl-accepting chemotaxis protein n=1 Tax=Terribacillus sp. DMT04 TaxID=2850441 RepID=UPI001C2BA659|nr:methyl-accepting chemotaxis protein [Terribacillus sp. DMT04]QXE00752.1 methyl-accepting chemotaxis protein [Terribacillus sp. DMT04]
MKLTRKLLWQSICTSALAFVLIAFIIMSMIRINASSYEQVQHLLQLQQLDSELHNAGQVLRNTSTIRTETSAADLRTYLDRTESNFEQLLSSSEGQSAVYLEAGKEKYEEWQGDVTSLLTNVNEMESLRLSSRVEGLLNDVYMANAYSTAAYEDEQLALQNQITFVIVVSLIGVLLLIVVTNYISRRTSKSIADPLLALASRTNQIAAGDLTVEPIDKAGSLEIKQMNEAFGQMTEQLKGLIGSIEKASNEVAGMSQEIDKDNQDLQSLHNDIAASVGEITSGSQRISADLQQTVELIEQMDKQGKANTVLATETVELGKLASGAATRGRETVVNQQQLTVKNNESRELMEASLRDFTQYSHQIEQMVASVSSVAEQTNLLALNAAIEAARAGEAGKGFAVVADEIRKLADESKVSADAIYKSVGAIRQGTMSLSDAVQFGNELAKAEAASMESMETSFVEIEEKFQAISGRLQQIQSGNTQSERLGGDVLSRMEQINSTLQENTAKTDIVHHSTNEQYEAYEQLAVTVSELERVTTDLQEAVSVFQTEAAES